MTFFFFSLDMFDSSVALNPVIFDSFDIESKSILDAWIIFESLESASAFEGWDPSSLAFVALLESTSPSLQKSILCYRSKGKKRFYRNIFFWDIRNSKVSKLKITIFSESPSKNTFTDKISWKMFWQPRIDPI